MADKRFVAKNGLDNNSQTITNVADPSNAQDAATKAFSSNASNLSSGTIAASILANSTVYIGTTAVALNRASASLALTGITSIDGNAATATKLATARNINGVSFDGSADITVTAAAGTLSGSTLASGVTASSLTSVGTLTNLTVTNAISGSVTGSSGSTTGNAATATKLATARNINGVSFDGSADITVTAAAGTLSGTTLASGVTASSLTSVGTLTSLTTSGLIKSTQGGIAVSLVTTASGTYGASNTIFWYQANGTTAKAGIGYMSDDSITFTVGSRITNGSTNISYGAGSTGLSISDVGLVNVPNNLSVTGTSTLTGDTSVGAAAANSTLSLVGLGSGSNSGPQFSFIHGTTLESAIGGYSRIIGGTYSANLTFYSNSHDFVWYSGAERMRLDASGNLSVTGTATAANLGYGSVVLANGATANGPAGEGILFVVRDLNAGTTAVVSYEFNGTPNIIWQSGSHYTTGSPSSSQVQISTRGGYGLGVQFTAGSAAGCTLQYSSLIAQT